MKKLLIKDEHQLFFEKEGYIVLPILEQIEVRLLKDYYESLNLVDERGTGFHVSMDNPNKELCREIRTKIWDISLPKMNEYLTNYKPFVASFTAKEPNIKSVVPPHQDWSFADNEKDGFCSITCWIALVDTTLDNGALGVIKGSHTLLLNERASPSPQTPVPLSNHMFSLFPYVKLIEMKAGEMLMFDNRTFHASPPNITNETRLAVGVGITQVDAQLVHYFLKPDGTKSKLLKYQVDEEFYLNYDNARLSDLYEAGKSIEGYGDPNELCYHFDDISQDDMVHLVIEKGNSLNVPLSNRMQELFGTPNQNEEISNQNESAYDTDTRSFFQKYTPLNIIREIMFRLKIIK